MSDRKIVEEKYNKYFSESIQYSDTWKDPLMDKLENKTYYTPVLRWAVLIVMLVLILISGLKVNKYYSIKHEKQKIREVLLSENAYYFVTYMNYGVIISDYYSGSSGQESDVNKLYSDTKDTLSLYWKMNSRDYSNGKKMEIVNEVIEEVTQNFLDYYIDNLDNGLI